MQCGHYRSVYILEICNQFWFKFDVKLMTYLKEFRNNHVTFLIAKKFWSFLLVQCGHCRSVYILQIFNQYWSKFDVNFFFSVKLPFGYVAKLAKHNLGATECVCVRRLYEVLFNRTFQLM